MKLKSFTAEIAENAEKNILELSLCSPWSCGEIKIKSRLKSFVVSYEGIAGTGLVSRKGAFIIHHLQIGKSGLTDIGNEIILRPKLPSLLAVRPFDFSIHTCRHG